MDNELLDFPPEKKENNDNYKSSFLPSFSESEVVEQLNSDELKIVRNMISEYKSKHSQKIIANNSSESDGSIQTILPQEPVVPVSNLFCDEPKETSTAVSAPMIPSENNSKDNNAFAIKLLEKQNLGDPVEADALNKMIEYAKTADEVSAECIAVAILALIPCKKFIRHGTPEQKLFVLKSLGDRFLDGIAGIKWIDRRKLIKAAANYLSSLSENYNFISMEGEGFNPTLHERVLGASGGNIIKEMRGFLVVARGTNRVTYAGVVLT